MRLTGYVKPYKALCSAVVGWFSTAVIGAFRSSLFRWVVLSVDSFIFSKPCRTNVCWKCEKQKVAQFWWSRYRDTESALIQVWRNASVLLHQRDPWGSHAQAHERLLQTHQQQKSWCKKAGWHTVRAKAAAVCPATALVWKISTTQSTIRWPRFSTGWLSGWPKPRVKGESPSSWSDARSWYPLSCISWPSCECWSAIMTSWTATSVTVISSWSSWTQTATTLSSLYPWLCTQNWIWDNKASVAGMGQVTLGLFKLEWEGSQMIVLCLKWY